jgi:hypothetical protein
VTVNADGAAGVSLHAHTDNDGGYRLEGLPPGACDVSSQLTGFATSVRRDVTVAEGTVTPLDATLHLSASASVVVLGRTSTRWSPSRSA